VTGARFRGAENPMEPLFQKDIMGLSWESLAGMGFLKLSVRHGKRWERYAVRRMLCSLYINNNNNNNNKKQGTLELYLKFDLLSITWKVPIRY
jgi:hypothetical protein